MNEKNKQFLQKVFRRDNLIVLILSGILLLVIVIPTEKKESDTGQFALYDAGKSSQSVSEPSAEAIGESDAVKQYAKDLENRLEEVLQGIHGVGKAEVMITLKSSEELVVEKDSPVTYSTTDESDSAGGSRVLSQQEHGESTIYRTDGNISEPYVIKTILPGIEGVLVVAEGAGNGEINKCITEIAQVLFDVEAHKVKVVKMRKNS